MNKSIRSGAFGLAVQGLLLLVLVTSACTGGETPGQKLQFAVMTYNHSLRWGNLQAAAAYLKAEKREEWLKRRRRLMETVNLLDYEIVDVRHLEMTSLDAEVTVTFSWSPKTSNIVETTSILQTWKYLDEEKRWELEGQKEIEREIPLESESIEGEL
ncbi:MAG: hypothetical protein IV100_31265 [Myxococcales bacterium]|nr:hypothetical protein [Myxococcales bacterium]